MIYHSTLSVDYLWDLILRGKQNKKTEIDPNTKFLAIFNGLNKNKKKTREDPNTNFLAIFNGRNKNEKT